MRMTGLYLVRVPQMWGTVLNLGQESVDGSGQDASVREDTYHGS